MFAMKRGTALLVSALLGGCETSPNSRLCNGFDHPAAAVWTENGGEGEVRTFVDEVGDTRRYTLTDVRRSGPRTQIDDRATSDEAVKCFESADYVYADGDIGYVFQFTQIENGVGQPLEEQLIELEVEVQNPLGVDIDIDLNPEFRLRDLESNSLASLTDGNTHPREQRYIPSRTVTTQVLLSDVMLDSVAGSR